MPFSTCISDGTEADAMMQRTAIDIMMSINEKPAGARVPGIVGEGATLYPWRCGEQQRSQQSPPLPVKYRERNGRSGGEAERQFHRRAARPASADGDPALVDEDDLLNNGQAETGPARAGGEEGTKDLFP